MPYNNTNFLSLLGEVIYVSAMATQIETHIPFTSKHRTFAGERKKSVDGNLIGISKRTPKNIYVIM